MQPTRGRRREHDNKLMAQGNTIVVRVLGNTKSLSRSLKKAQVDLAGLDRINANIGAGFRTAAIAAAVFGAATVGAGAVGAASLAAIPAAILGIGIAFAAMNPKVKKAFGELKTNVVGTMQTLAKPLVAPLIRAAGNIQKAFDAIAPSFGRMFKAGAPLIDQFSKGLIPVAKQLGPVLERAFAAGIPVLQAFGGMVKPLIKGIDGFFKALGKGSPQFVEFIGQLGQSFKKLLPALGRLITALAPIGTVILSVLIPALVSLLDWVSGKIGPAFEKLTGVISAHPDLFKKIGIGVIVFVGALKAAGLAVAVFNSVMGAAGVVTAVFSGIMTAAAAVQTAFTAASIGTRIGLAALAVQTAVTSAVTKAAAVAQWALNIAMAANPIGVVVIAIIALVAAFVIAYKKSETFRKVVDKAWTAIKNATVTVWNFIKKHIKTIMIGILVAITGPVGLAVLLVVKNWNRIKSATSTAWNAIKSVVSSVARGISTAVKVAMAAIKGTMTAVWNAVKSATQTAWNGIKNAVSTAINGLMTLVNGIKGRVTGAFAGAAGWLLSAGKNIIQGLLDGIGSMVDKVQGALGAITDKIPDWKGPKQRDKKLLRPVGQLIMRGLIKGFEDGRAGIKATLGRVTDLIEKTMNKRFKNDKKAARMTKAAMKSLGNETKALMKNAKKREAVYKRLDAAKDKLKDLRDAYKDYAKSVKEGVLNYTNITGLGTAFNSNAMVAELKKRLEKVRQFATLIQTLIAQGLNSSMIDQLVQAGVEGGLATAQAIANGGAGAIAEFNALQQQINQAAGGLGQTAAGSMYDAGIAAAEGLVEGLKARAKALQKIAKQLAKDLVAAIKKALDINSPSKVFKKLGEYTVLGMEIGLKDTSGVKRGMVNLANAMTDSFARPQLSAVAGGSAGGNTYQINVTAPATVDKAALGREIVTAIDAYERNGGRRRA